ncbi:MAG: glycerate kinase [Marinilabiliales bacterium]|nr:MAG: glycerate kinase [Marinilabiliales bacterium]
MLTPGKKILIAPDSFKDCLPAEEVARYLGEGISERHPDAGITLFPVADGGEGTTACISFHRGGTWKKLTVSDPLHRPVQSGYLVLEDEQTAVIELAAASGLELLTPEERNPLRTSTLGTGELIKDALDSGVEKIILTVGGSATVDGGIGIASALGFRFTGEEGGELAPCGEAAGKIREIDSSGVHPRLKDTPVIIATDVQNLLNGSEGAARVYGPQKGADEEAVGILETGLRNLSGLIFDATGFEADVHPGTGAAGGAALFLMAYGKGTLERGFDIVAGLTGFDVAIRESDIIITGEGRIDTQTAYGKVVASVAGMASAAGKTLVIVAGIAEGDRQELRLQYGAAGVYSLADIAEGMEDSIANAAEYLKATGLMIADELIHSADHL